MGLYNQIRDTSIEQYKTRPSSYRERIVKWSGEGPIVRVPRPTNLARARKLGYKAKEGVLIVRVGITKGRTKRKTASGGRKPSKSGRYFTREKSNQAISEERAARRYSNCEVLNSYFVGESGTKSFFEVILLDRASKSLQSDKDLSAIISKRNRANKGLTASGRRHRGLMR